MGRNRTETDWEWVEIDRKQAGDGLKGKGNRQGMGTYRPLNGLERFTRHKCMRVRFPHLAGQLLVLLHQLLVLLVDGQDFADAVGSSLRLAHRRYNHHHSHSPQRYRTHEPGNGCY